MKTTKNKRFMACTIPAALVLLSACSDDSNDYRDISEPVLIDFNTGENNFNPIFSDYPQGQEQFYELASSHQALPSPFENENGYRLYGSNRSDDLFMGVYGKIDNLKPAKSYELTFSATIVSNVPSNCVGIGGAPGESVYIKVATHTQPPTNELDDDMYRLDWDIGAQSNRGEHSQVVGDISNGVDCMEQEQYVEKTMKAQQSIPVIANDNGEVWVLMGSDSGFEGPTELLIKNISVTFSN